MSWQAYTAFAIMIGLQLYHMWRHRELEDKIEFMSVESEINTSGITKLVANTKEVPRA